MRIVEVRERRVSISSEIRNAYISFSTMDVSLVAMITDVIREGAPVVGFGFNSNGRYAPTWLLRDRFIPRLLAAPPAQLLDDAGTNFDPARAWQVMMQNEKPGGHGERSVAVGVLDMALWDAVAKIAERPLSTLLAERYRHGQVESSVSVYAAGGYYYPGKDDNALRDELKGYLELGYRSVKLKIGGAPLERDLQRIEAAIDVVGDGRMVAVDANGRFDLETALQYATALEPYDLMWFEEAGDPLDYQLQAAIAERYTPPLATGENLFSHQDARNLLRYGGMRSDRDVLQFDPALSYGLVEYLQTLDVLEEMGWSRRRCVPHGGHQLALHIAAGLGIGGNESYPGVFEPFGGFADSMSVVDGRVGLPDVPGIGLECKAALAPLLYELRNGS